MASKGYTTKEQIEDYMLIEIDPSFDTRVDQWIAAMESYVDRFTSRNFKAATAATQKTFSVSEDGILYIPDAVAITEVLIDDEPIVENTTLVNGYYLGQNDGQPIRYIKYPGLYRGYKNVKITAKWGSYITPPDDIVFATTVLVAGIINNGANSGGEVQSETIGRYTVTYKTNQQKMDFDTVKEILKSYKSYRFV